MRLKFSHQTYLFLLFPIFVIAVVNAIVQIVTTRVSVQRVSAQLEAFTQAESLRLVRHISQARQIMIATHYQTATRQVLAVKDLSEKLYSGSRVRLNTRYATDKVLVNVDGDDDAQRAQVRTFRAQNATIFAQLMVWHSSKANRINLLTAQPASFVQRFVYADVLLHAFTRAERNSRAERFFSVESASGAYASYPIPDSVLEKGFPQLQTDSQCAQKGPLNYEALCTQYYKQAATLPYTVNFFDYLPESIDTSLFVQTICTKTKATDYLSGAFTIVCKVFDFEALFSAQQQTSQLPSCVSDLFYVSAGTRFMLYDSQKAIRSQITIEQLQFAQGTASPQEASNFVQQTAFLNNASRALIDDNCAQSSAASALEEFYAQRGGESSGQWLFAPIVVCDVHPQYAFAEQRFVTRTIGYFGAVVEQRDLDAYVYNSIARAVTYQEVQSVVLLLLLHAFVLALIWYLFLILRVVIEPVENLVYAMQCMTQHDVANVVRTLKGRAPHEQEHELFQLVNVMHRIMTLRETGDKLLCMCKEGALYPFRELLEVYMSLGFRAGVADAHFSIGLAYYAQAKFVTALEHLQTALATCEDEKRTYTVGTGADSGLLEEMLVTDCQYRHLLGVIALYHYVIAEVFMKLLDYEKACTHLHQCVDIHELLLAQLSKFHARHALALCKIAILQILHARNVKEGARLVERAKQLCEDHLKFTGTDIDYQTKIQDVINLKFLIVIALIHRQNENYVYACQTLTRAYEEVEYYDMADFIFVADLIQEMIPRYQALCDTVFFNKAARGKANYASLSQPSSNSSSSSSLYVSSQSPPRAPPLPHVMHDLRYHSILSVCQELRTTVQDFARNLQNDKDGAQKMLQLQEGL